MFEKLTPEYQVNKRIRSFLLHTATSQNIDPVKTKLLFKSHEGKASVQVYEEGRHVCFLNLSSILDFFFFFYKESHSIALQNYLQKVAAEEGIGLPSLHLVICEANNNLGAHVYEGGKYRKKISTVDLVAHFLQSQHE